MKLHERCRKRHRPMGHYLCLCRCTSNENSLERRTQMPEVSTPFSPNKVGGYFQPREAQCWSIVFTSHWMVGTKIVVPSLDNGCHNRASPGVPRVTCWPATRFRCLRSWATGTGCTASSWRSPCLCRWNVDQHHNGHILTASSKLGSSDQPCR